MNLDITGTTATAIDKLLKQEELKTLIIYLNNLEDDTERRCGLGMVYLRCLQENKYDDADEVAVSLYSVDLQDLKVNLENLITECVKNGTHNQAARLAGYNNRTLTGTELKNMFDFHLKENHDVSMQEITKMMEERLLRLKNQQDEAHD
ncbi:MAG: hypothetical protein WCO55_05630 [Candidatus Falkowbacteria bacterium]